MARALVVIKRTLCPDAGVRLSVFAHAGPEGLHLLAVDAGPQRPPDRPPCERSIEARSSWMEVGAAPGKNLTAIDPQHPAVDHHADQFCFVAPLAAAGAGANRATHCPSLAR